MAKQKLNGISRVLKAVPTTKKGKTVVQIATAAGVKPASASVYLSTLLREGSVSVAGSIPNSAGRGRPFTTYRR